jgi:Caspase domain/TIR domain
VEELSTNTQGQQDVADPTKRKYDVYFSYNRADTGRKQEITDRLQAFKPEFRWFDEDEFIPGTSETEARERALVDSNSMAVLLGRDQPSSNVKEDLNQVVRQSIDKGTRAFVVYLPGWEGEAEMPPSLLDRRPIDLRQQFDGDRLTSEGLVLLIAGAWGVSARQAGEWLEQGGPRPSGPTASPSRLRAMIVGIHNYDRYQALPAADADVRSVEQLLRSTAPAAEQGRWEILPRFAGQTNQELGDAAKAFLTTDAHQDDTLLFYFSGHGAVVDNDVHLVVGTTDPDNLRMTAVPGKALADWVKSSPARRKLVILDCCFSGEASDGMDWGTGAAVLMTSRQVVWAADGTSELTGGITAAWSGGAQTTGELLDRLQRDRVDVRANRGFDRSIPLPRTQGGEGWTATENLPSARLRFDERGDLVVSLSSSDATTSQRTEMASWLQDRKHLLTNLIEMIDAVVSLVPAEHIPMESVRKALSSLGADLLGSALTQEVRAALGRELEAWQELRLELSFDDEWSERDSWERVPWESLSLCQDRDRAIWLERVVRAKATKGLARRRPSRVIAWNAFSEPNPRYGTGAKHLLTHLLREEVAHQPPPTPMLVVKEPARWFDLAAASMDKSVTFQEPDESNKTTESPITDFDTLLLFAPVSLASGEPVVWFPKGTAMEATRAQSLVEQLGRWTLSYLVIETIAGPSALLQTGSVLGPAQPRTLQATTHLATKLARELGITVVAVCHLSSFIDAARTSEDPDSPFKPSFSGLLLRQLADPSRTLYEAAREARRFVVVGLNREDSLDVGLPIVCRPEREAPRARATAGGTTPLRLETPTGQ